MRKSVELMFHTFIILTFLMSGCAPASAPVSSTFTPSSVPPTFKPEPIETNAPIASPTALPGSVVIPLEKMGTSVPWLPLDQSAHPSTYVFFFNLSKPPFNNLLVRQAFAAAIDKGALVEIAQEYGVRDAQPATTFTPPQTLGRYLYNEVGIPFNPEKARDLFAQAGYTDTSQFPPITLLTGVENISIHGLHDSIAEAIFDMWRQHLGITITIERLDNATFFERIASNPTEIFRATFYPKENNDPASFLPNFHTDSQKNFGGFFNAEFDTLVETAWKSTDPAERQELYIQAERILCETETAIIPIYHAAYP